MITEKLQLPSTDTNVALLRELLIHSGRGRLLGWVLDEGEAYRQIPIQIAHRRFSVICSAGVDRLEHHGADGAGKDQAPAVEDDPWKAGAALPFASNNEGASVEQQPHSSETTGSCACSTRRER